MSAVEQRKVFAVVRYMESPSSRWLAGAAVLVLALIVAAVIIRMVVQSGGPSYPEDSPEGTVQRYLLAVQDNDVQAAYDFLGENLKESCPLQHFVQTTSYQRQQDFGASIRSSELVDDVYLISVEISDFYYEPPFGSDRNFYTVEFTLQSEGDVWKFSEPPWPMSWCPPVREPPATSGASPTPAVASGSGAERP